jgi:two-component sensor histidine kinase
MIAVRVAPRDALLWEPRNLVRAVEAAGVALWSWNVDTNALAMDDHAYELWDIPRDRTVRFEDLSAHVHPADRDIVREAFMATRAVHGAFEIDFRILSGDKVKWISVRGQGNDAGMVHRIKFGTFIDVTGRKEAEEAHALLAGEMSHRVKNLLAIASGLVSITARSTETIAEMAHELTLRLTALARAHDLVRPSPGQMMAASANLGDLLAVLLAPYSDLGACARRIQLLAPGIRVGQATTTMLALVVHELATNSLKYGALSAEGGVLNISCSAQADAVTIVWAESGGPEVRQPDSEGYGSKLVERTVTSHLRGTIDYDWAETGLVVTLKLPRARLAA